MHRTSRTPMVRTSRTPGMTTGPARTLRSAALQHRADEGVTESSVNKDEKKDDDDDSNEDGNAPKEEKGWLDGGAQEPDDSKSGDAT